MRKIGTADSKCNLSIKDYSLKEEKNIEEKKEQVLEIWVLSRVDIAAQPVTRSNSLKLVELRIAQMGAT